MFVFEQQQEVLLAQQTDYFLIPTGARPRGGLLTKKEMLVAPAVRMLPLS
jgi:hypothetical protein